MKLSLGWRGPRRIVMALSDFVYQYKDVRNGELADVHISRIRSYADRSLNGAALMTHIIYSEAGMPVSRLMHQVADESELKVQGRWRGFPDS